MSGFEQLNGEQLAELLEELRKNSVNMLLVTRQILDINPAAARACNINDDQARALMELTVSEVASLANANDVNHSFFTLAIRDRSLSSFVQAAKNSTTLNLAGNYIS